MTITGQRLLTELGHKAWSGFNADDMTWSLEESITARTELNSALRYLFSLADFPFKEETQKIRVSANKSSYIIPFGQVANVYLISNGERTPLVYTPEGNEGTTKGTPTGYCFDVKEVDTFIKLFPIPDSNYQIELEYTRLEPVINADGDKQFEFINGTDYINMPDSIAYYFMDCLVLKTMEQNNKDDQDENYAPIINEFNQRWKEFKKIARPIKTETRIIWV